MDALILACGVQVLVFELQGERYPEDDSNWTKPAPSKVNGTAQ